MTDPAVAWVVYCLSNAYKFTYSRTYSHYFRVGAHQRQGKSQKGKTSKKSEEKERDRGTEGKTPKTTQGN